VIVRMKDWCMEGAGADGEEREVESERVKRVEVKS